MFAVIGIGVAAVVAGVLGFAATKPDSFRVQRSVKIDATPEKIFGLINDFRQWEAWSPWDKIDPDLKRTYSGASSGKGAIYSWEGNKKVGSGRMEITDVSAPSRVGMKLDFYKPFEAHNTTEFTLQPDGNSTNVAWTMHGQNLYMGKVMSVFMNMDEFVGKDFEKGLAAIKTIAEG